MAPVSTEPAALPPASELIGLCRAASLDMHGFASAVGDRLPERAGAGAQFFLHGHAWIETLAAAMSAVTDWAEGLQREGRLQDLESRILAAVAAGYLQHILCGVAMSQDEVVRPRHYGLQDKAHDLLARHAGLLRFGVEDTGSALLDEMTRRGSLGDSGLDETLQMVADQFRAFCDSKVSPHAPQWHNDDRLIPEDLIRELSELGVFGLTIDPAYGGSGLGKLAMCVVTEELSRGYIGVGSLGTRAEIAGELIGQNGTEEQKQRFLPGIASGRILPAAVFTEPGNGSDLAHLRSRAVPDATGWRLSGQKTWITHAARADLMTVLARSEPEEAGHRGLSLFLLEKTRGTESDPFPDTGISGEEIGVLGYRGMKEYTLGFDDVALPRQALLGGAGGRGFAQLMSTFEAARIQTAARAVGVAVNAFELGLSYAQERVQFGAALISFQRVHGKLAQMIVDIAASRQLTYAAARAKDLGQRCDIEAGMAKLLAARTAWSCADNALQIHGGNGYALEYPISRVLCDARILNIFEGAAEIQAEVIARGLQSNRRRAA